MSTSPIDPELARILTTAVESVERLEILLVMRREQPRAFSAKALRAHLAVAGAALDTHLAILCGRGFLGVTIGNDLVYAYQPISPRIDQQATDLAALWASRRSDVEALLNGRAKTPAQDFADAFLFGRKRDGKDG